MLSTSDGQMIALGMARRGKARMRRGVLYHTPRDYGVLGIFADGTPGILGDYRSPGLSFFTDAAGLVPALPGNPVRFVRDTSGRGNHRVQATLAQRPTLTRWPKSGLRNLVRQSGTPGVSPWTSTAYTVTPNAALDSTGAMSLAKLVINNGSTSTSGGGTAQSNTSITAPGAYTASAEVRAGEFNSVRLYIVPVGGSISDAANLAFNTSTLATSTSGGRYTGHSVTELSPGLWRITVTGDWPDPISGIDTHLYAYHGGSIVTGDGTSGIYAGRVQLERGAAATAYQSAVSQYDITEAGQRSCYGLWYDGVDDRLVTQGNVDFSGGDHLTAIMGLTKIADIRGQALNQSGSASGAPMLQAPFNEGTGNYRWRTSDGTGTQVATDVTGLFAPTSNLVTGTTDAGAAQISLRVDGSHIQTQTGATPWSLPNAPVTTGSQDSGATQFFNGIEWGLLLAGKALPLTTLAQAEAIIAANTPEVTL